LQRYTFFTNKCIKKSKNMPLHKNNMPLF
jgi:hypothetical protein